MGRAHIWTWPGPYVGPARAQYGLGPWAGPMGPGPPVMGQEDFSETVSWKTLILYISLDTDILVIWQKRRAPKNDEIWRRFRAEISHMRPIQGRKLKPFKVSIQGKLTLMSTKCIKNTNNFSEWGAQENASN